MTTEPLPSWMTDDPEVMAQVRANTSRCTDPDCEDYDALDRGGLPFVDRASDVDDPWAAQPPPNLWERIRRWTRGSRCLGSVRVGERQVALLVDLQTWMIGVSWHWSGWAVRVGPLVVSVEEPPF